MKLLFKFMNEVHKVGTGWGGNTKVVIYSSFKGHHEVVWSIFHSLAIYYFRNNAQYMSICKLSTAWNWTLIKVPINYLNYLNYLNIYIYIYIYTANHKICPLVIKVYYFWQLVIKCFIIFFFLINTLVFPSFLQIFNGVEFLPQVSYLIRNMRSAKKISNSSSKSKNAWWYDVSGKCIGRDHTFQQKASVIAVKFIVIAVHATSNTMQYYEWRHVLQS